MLQTLSFQYRVDLTCTNFFSFARSFSASVSPMHRTGVRPCSFTPRIFSRSVRQTLCGKYDVQVADDDVLCADVFQHSSRGFTVNAPDRFRSTFCAPSMMWLLQLHASPYRCTFPVVRLQPHASNTCQLFTQVRNQLVNHVALPFSFQLPITKGCRILILHVISE